MYSNAGFHHAPVSKCLVGWFSLSHVALQVPMFQWLHKYLLCRIPGSLSRGEWWRVFTTRLAVVDTKDAVLSVLLIYTFRLFERRYGSRKFCSHMLSTFILATCVELALNFGLTSYYGEEFEAPFLSFGPVSVIFSWFVPFFYDVPNLYSTFLTTSFISSKFLTYAGGVHLLVSSRMNLLAGISGIISGLLLRHNFLWWMSWCKIPEGLAKFTQRCLGRFIESSPRKWGIMGATLEIQRSQQLEAYEQQYIRQQLRQRRANVGQGFAERLVDDQAAFGNAWEPFQALNNRMANRPQPEVTPTEANIRTLMDMGFSRNRVETALRRSNNDVQLATTVLLQEN